MFQRRKFHFPHLPVHTKQFDHWTQNNWDKWEMITKESE